MSTELAKQDASLKSLLQSDAVTKRISEILGKRASTFTTSVLQIVQNNSMLQEAAPQSVLNAAIVSATLDLPLNSNLGFAYIVPYKGREGCVAQFQIGYKGIIQLAQRSGQYLKISSTPIYEGQIVENNPLTGYVFDFNIKGEKIIGYAAYFKLVNGFESTLYLTIEELTEHGRKYSQSFKKGFGLWKDNFDAMASKTVLKLLISKFGPLSIDMQKAVEADQAVVNEDRFHYIDNDPLAQDKVLERHAMLALDAINEATTLSRLAELRGKIGADVAVFVVAGKSISEWLNEKMEGFTNE